jgi:nicotinamide-nucleotide amidase
MKVQIISIGDEILIGDTINTNAAFISSELIKNQFVVTKVSVVGDNEENITYEFKEALKENDIVIVTGGLGPTHDDITKKCLSKFFESELVMNEEVLKNIKTFFEKRRRKLTKENEMQALVPKIAEVINNLNGTAPGLWIEKNKKILVSLPGVPHEIKALIESKVIPKLLLFRGEAPDVRKVKLLLTTGIPESYLFKNLGDLDSLLKGANLAFLPDQFGVKLRITVEDINEETALNRLSEIEQKIRSAVGRFIYGSENITLEEVVGRLLKERDLTISVAESCTGGLICDRFTNIDGSSKFFERGVISYSNAAKVEILKVSEDAIAEFGAVSEVIAKQMAEGIRAISVTDIGLSTTGIMGPTGGSKEKPIGLFYVGLSDDNMSIAKKFHFGDDRILNKARATQAALEMLRRYLLGIPYE